MKHNKTLLLSATALASVCAFTAATPVFAQDATTTPAPVASVGELVVTGTRIPKPNYTSSAPIQIISSDTAQLQGLADVGALLQEQPIASGSFQTNGLLTGYLTGGGPGVETISLRGLGANRSLVLLNGRRLGPAGVRGSVGPVDLNVLPQSILDRVDIYKDGASSIYGSDAVAGVVNFITKRNTEGGEMNVFGSLPQRQGGGQYEISGTFGKTFDKGFIALTADYNVQEELTAGERSYTKCATDNAYDPTTHARLDYIDPATGSYKCYNVFANSFEAGGVYGGVFQFSQPGIPGQASAAGVSPYLSGLGFVRAGRATHNDTQPYLNYDSPLYARSSAISPYQRGSLFLTGGLDLTPKTEMYTEILLNQRQSQQHGFQQMFPDIPAGNPFNPIGNAHPTASGPLDAIPIIAIPLDGKQTVNYGRGVLGFKGNLNDSLPVIHGWKWDIYGEFSDSDASYTTSYTRNDRLNAVTGAVGCDTSQETISPVVACPNGGTGINFFSQNSLAGNFSQEERNFLFAEATGKTTYYQELVEGYVAGDLFQLPAGPLGADVGFTVRHESIDDTPSAAELAQNLYNLSSATVTKGDDTVKEVFAELSAPLLKGLPLTKSLDMDLSGRYTNYASYGSSTTYKVGLDWALSSSVRLKGTIGTSFRGPSLYELYLGNQTGFYSQTDVDPCIHYELSTNPVLQTNCAAAGIPSGYTGSGAGLQVTAKGGKGVLKAETSLASTLSVVWTPAFANLTVEATYFDIDISNEISQLPASSIAYGCYSSTIYPADPLCALIAPRNASHGLTNIDQDYINIANEVNRGVDLSVRYRRKFFSEYKLEADLDATWQFQDRTILLPGSLPVDSNGTTTEPAFSAEAQVAVQRGDWTAFWSTEVLGKASDTGLLSFQNTDIHSSTRYNQNVYYKQQTEFTAYHTASVRWRHDKLTVTGGVKNLFDEAPPSLSGNEGFRTGYSALNAYDLVGRSFFVQIGRKF